MLMKRRTPIATRNDTLFPYTTLFRSMSVTLGTEATKELIGDIEQDAALLASEDNAFLIKMGVSRKLLTDIMYQQRAVATADDKSTRRCLTLDEALKYGVTYALE